MALNFYLSITGETQGEIQGSVTQAGRENKMECFALEHEVISPRDAASGLPTGKRQHKPIRILKAIDKASPGLMSALTNNENLTEVKLEFWRPSATGVEEQYYTIELVNASIAGIYSAQFNNKIPDLMPRMYEEWVHLAYQKITWTWEDGGLTAEDDWEAPQV